METEHASTFINRFTSVETLDSYVDSVQRYHNMNNDEPLLTTTTADEPSVKIVDMSWKQGESTIVNRCVWAIV